jgi:hypothetical protein
MVFLIMSTRLPKLGAPGQPPGFPRHVTFLFSSLYILSSLSVETLMFAFLAPSLCIYQAFKYDATAWQPLTSTILTYDHRGPGTEALALLFNCL